MVQATFAPSIFARLFGNNNPQPLLHSVVIDPPLRGFSRSERVELTLLQRRAEVLLDQLARGRLSTIAERIATTVADPLRDLELALAAEITPDLYRALSNASYGAASFAYVIDNAAADEPERDHLAAILGDVVGDIAHLLDLDA